MFYQLDVIENNFEQKVNIKMKQNIAQKDLNWIVEFIWNSITK